MPRLPQPGSDHGAWGDILNEFLSQALAANGQLKPDTVGSVQLKDNAVTADILAPNSVTSAALASNAVTAAIIADGTITETLLDTALQAKINIAAPVTSVSGKAGIVMLDKSDVGLDDVDNTSDANKPISTETQSALDGKLDKVNTINALYGTDGTGGQFGYTVTQGAANANTIARRTGSGAIFTGSPTAGGHATTKDYVDTATANMVTTAGTQTLINKTLTNPRINQVLDTNGIVVMNFVAQANAVNYLNVSNRATGSAPFIQAVGSDANIDITLWAKGTGNVKIYSAVSGQPVGITANSIDASADLHLSGKGTGGVALPVGNGFYIYNTADQTTNYERLRMSWSGNIASVAAEFGGTGSPRVLELKSSATLRIGTSGNSGLYQFATGSSSTLGKGVLVSGTYTPATGYSTIVSIAPTISQSGTASYTALHINPTETSTGSGSKRLISAQLADVDKFSVDNTGKITTAADTLNVAVSKTPSSSTDTGTTGDICWDQNYVYVCVATNTWKRSSLTAW